MKNLLTNKLVLLSVLLTGSIVLLGIKLHHDKTVNKFTVELREDGFHPTELTIEKGTTVTFINLKGGLAWPASDPHPSHTIYSDFDAKGPIAEGDSWSFTFNKIGSWSFHDHLSPYFIGRINVVEKSSKNIIYASCELKPDSKECWTETLTDLLNKKGLEAVLDKVADYYANNPSFAYSCHDVMHDIGHKSYKNYLDDKDSVITPKAFYCANGFYHGFMASYIVATQSLDKARDFCNMVGKKLSKEAPDAKLQCFHGIGHGILEDGFENNTNKTSEDDIIIPALKKCEIVADLEDELYRCASGIFNGIANFYMQGLYGFKINVYKPFATCEKQEDKFKQSCYGNFNSLILSLAQGDFSKASNYIVKMKDEKYKEGSIRYLAALDALDIAKRTPEKAILACRRLGTLEKPCLEGFVHGFLEHGEPNNEWKEAVFFCENKILTSDEVDICLHYSLSWLGSWYSEKKSQEICETVKPEYKRYCQKK